MNAEITEKVNAIRDGAVVVDRKGVIQFANDKAESMFGYAAGEMVGLPIETLVPESERGTHANVREAYQQAPEARPMGERDGLVGRRSDETYIRVEVSLEPVDNDGEPMVVATVVDVSQGAAL